MLEGKAEKNLGFPSFYAKIKKTSASLIFYPPLSDGEIMPVVTKML